MANFPTNPSIGDLFETKHDTFKWNGSGWEALGRILTHRTPPTTALSSLSIKEGGGSLDEADEDTVLLIAETDFTGVVKAAHSNDASTSLLLQENVDPGLSESVSDANTKLLIGETIASGLSANTADVPTSFLLNSSFDSSNSNHALTPSGDAKLVKGYSFDGSDDWMEMPVSSDFAFTGDFTIEFWAWKSADGDDGNDVVLGTSGAAAGGSTGWFVEWSNSRGLWFYDCPNSAGILSFNTNPLDSTWHHIAIVRNSETVKLYIDGVEKDSATYSATLAAGNPLRVGASGNGDGYGPAGNGDCPFNGYVNDVRISTSARYTANFTTEITAIDANHKLVLDGKATDSSASVHAITFNGNATEVSKLGGTSWKFDGTGDYLAVSDSGNLDWAGDFTVECWVRFSSFPSASQQMFVSATDDGSMFRLYWDQSNTRWNAAVRSTLFTCNDSLSVDTWYHIAFTRENNVCRIFRDGVEKGSQSISGTVGNTGGMTIGAYAHLTTAGQYPFHGYMDEFRISKDVARYSANFTPHTVPHTTDIATKLLLQGSPDSSGLHLPTFSGDAEIVPAGYRFPDNLASTNIKIPNSDDFNFGSGRFTIEFWIKWDDVTNYESMMSFRHSTEARKYWSFDKPGPNPEDFRFYANNGSGGSNDWNNPYWNMTYAFQSDTWYHIALSRNGTGANDWYTFVNGQSVSMVKHPQVAPGNHYALPMPDFDGDFTLGGGTSNNYMTVGIINDIRISKGVARYTSNFTEPVTTKDSNHVLILEGTESDLSDSAHSLSFNGNVTTLTKTAGHSMSFDGNDYITIPDSSDFNFGTDPFTVEFWLNTSATNSFDRIVTFGSLAADRYWTVAYQPSGQKWEFVVYNGGSWQATGRLLQADASDLTANTWHHLAMVRESEESDPKLYINGIEKTFTAHSSSQAMPTLDFAGYSGSVLKVGAWASGDGFNGYVNDLRITKGTARYTSNFYLTDTTVPSDKSSNSHTLTAVGNAALSTTQKKFGIHSLYFDGAGDYISIPYHADFDFGTDPFTVEFWVNDERTSDDYDYLIDFGDGSGAAFNKFSILRAATNKIGAIQYLNGSFTGGPWYAGNSTLPPNQWNHVAVVWDGTKINIYVNGSSVLSETAPTFEALNYSSASGSRLTIGARYINGSYDSFFKGYLDDIRISDTARYTSNFVVNYTATLVDNSSTGHALTLNGNATLSTTKKKFGTHAMYFDGTGDDVTIGSDIPGFEFGTGDFTVECWYNTSAGGGQWANPIVAYGTNAGNTSNWKIYGGEYLWGYIWNGSTEYHVTATTATNDNEWHHVALCRDGNIMRLFIDGVIEDTVDVTGISPNDAAAATFYVGTDGAGTRYSGYIDDVRVSKGIARYTSNFYLDDTTVAADQTTSPHTLTLAGNAGLSTTQTKFGNHALSFDGTGDYISTSSMTLDGDFTIEAWVYPESLSLFKIMTIGDSKTAAGLELYYVEGTEIRAYSNDTTIVSTSVEVTVNTWQHVALVRSGSTMTIYKDGVSIGTGTNSTTFTGTTRIGAEYYNGAINGTANGYMDEFRISTSARYTANFTPQSAAHDLIDNRRYGSPIFQANNRGLFANKNGLVMKSSDGTLTKLNAGTNAQTTGIRKMNAVSDTPVPNSYHLNNSLFDQTTIHTGDGMSWEGVGDQERKVLTTIYIWQMVPYIDSSGAVPLLKFVMVGHAGHASDDFEEIDTGVQIGNAGDLAVSTVSGFEMRNGSFIDGKHYIRWKHKHDAKSDTHYTVTALVTCTSNVFKTYIASITSTNDYYGYPTDEYTENDTNWLQYQMEWDPIAGDWSVQDDDTRWVELASTDVINIEGDGGLLRKVSRQYSMQEDAADGRMWEIGVRAKPALFTHNGPDVNTKLLLHMDGADDGTVFTDSSASSHVVTAAGDAATKVGEKKFGVSSAYFDGSGDYATIPTHSDFNLGTGDFTIETWINWSSTASHMEIAAIGVWTSGLEWIWLNNNRFKFYIANTTVIDGATNSFTPVVGQWYHLAVTRSGTDCKIFVDGTQIGSTGTSSGSISSAGGGGLVYIGNESALSVPFHGYMDEFRISNTARYTANFTPPTSAVTGDRKRTLDVHPFDVAVANGEAFTDTSGFGSTVTALGNAALSTTTKKFGTSSYYFANALTDKLTIADHAVYDGWSNHHDFTVECWFKTSNQNQAYIWGKHDSGVYAKFALQLMANGNLRLLVANTYDNNYTIIQETSGHSALHDNEWHHCAVTKKDISTTQIWVDGVKRLDIPNTNYEMDICIDHDMTVGGIGCVDCPGFVGYIDEFHVADSAKYTEDFTPESTTGIEPGLYYRDPKGVLTKIS